MQHDVSESVKNTTVYFRLTALYGARRATWRDASLIFLADGERINLPNAKYLDGFLDETRVENQLGCVIPILTFKKIVTAKNVEFQLGEFEHQLTELELSLFRDLLAKAEGHKP